MTNPSQEKTLRDEFAMAALTGLLASESLLNTKDVDTLNFDVIADLSYRYADAMLAERMK